MLTQDWLSLVTMVILCSLSLSFPFFSFTGIKHGREILLGYCADQPLSGTLHKGYIFPLWFDCYPSNSNPFPELPQLGALQSHYVIWWWFSQKRSEDNFTHLRSQLSSFSLRWLWKRVTKHLEKQRKSDESRPLFCIQYFPTTAINKQHQGTNNTAKKI